MRFGEERSVLYDLPLVTQLAGKAVQVINVLLGSHDHLECWDEFTARRTVPRHAEQPGQELEKREPLGPESSERSCKRCGKTLLIALRHIFVTLKNEFLVIFVLENMCQIRNKQNI